MAAVAGTAAHAAVIVSSTAGAPDPGPSAIETTVINFDSGLPAGVTMSGVGHIVSGTVVGKYAAPAGDNTAYLAAGDQTGGGVLDLSFAGLLGSQNVQQFSLYWGSIDKMNTLQLLDRAGNVFFTLTGADLPPASGSQTSGLTNRRVTFTLTGANQDLGGLRLSAAKPAFEIDTLALATLSAVPEPASWAIMLLGLAGMGAVLRSRARPCRA